MVVQLRRRNACLEKSATVNARFLSLVLPAACIREMSRFASDMRGQTDQAVELRRVPFHESVTGWPKGNDKQNNPRKNKHFWRYTVGGRM